MSDAGIFQRRTRPLARLGRAVKAMLTRAAHPPRRGASRPSVEAPPLLFPTGAPMPQRHQDALAVLDAARNVIDRGWVQNAWYVIQTPGGDRFSLAAGGMTRVDPGQVVQACLVGAVLHGAWRQSPRPEHAHPAIDALWRTLHGPRSDWDAEPVGPVSSPPVRAARVRDLTIWNDAHDRTKEDALELLDRTAARISRVHRSGRP